MPRTLLYANPADRYKAYRVRKKLREIGEVPAPAENLRLENLRLQGEVLRLQGEVVRFQRAEERAKQELSRLREGLLGLIREE